MFGQKKGLKNSDKKIIISILPSIDYNLENNNFLKDLENKIYFELNKVN